MGTLFLPIKSLRLLPPKGYMMNLAIKQDSVWNLRKQDGKGMLGCMLALALLFVGSVMGIRIFPTYYAHKSFQTDVRTEVSRAGAQFLDDETVMKNIIALARRNEIRLTRNNVKLERFAGQVHITVKYTGPVDFFVFKRDMEFEIEASSFVGKL
jgi:hypothetical protein